MMTTLSPPISTPRALTTVFSRLKVRLVSLYGFLYAVEELEFARVDGVDVSDDAEDGLIGAGGAMYVEAARAQFGDDVLDALIGGVFLHDDDHGISL
jgi:hypothetical protein